MKKFIIVLFCFILTGCTADYTLYIDEDLNFKEQIIIKENNKYFKDMNKSVDEYVDFNKNFYEEDEIYRDFKYKIKKYSDHMELEATSKKMNIDKFNNYSIIFNSLYSQIFAEKKDGELIIKTTDYDGFRFFKEPYSLGDPSYEKATFTINTPLKLISSNADMVDEEKGIYTWNFARGDKGKNIEIILDTNIDFLSRLIMLLKKYWYFLVIIILSSGIILRVLSVRKLNRMV